MRRLCVFCGSNPGHDPAYRALAAEVGSVLARQGIGIVYGGGRIGLMGALADAALAAGGEVNWKRPRRKTCSPEFSAINLLTSPSGSPQRRLRRVGTPTEDAMTNRAETLIAALALSPHPEGGYYGELYRSPTVIHPTDGRGPRAALTTIYFLLTGDTVSRWHRVWSDEVWHFYEGAPLDLWLASPGGDEVGRHRLGPLDGGQQPVQAVPGGWWQAARSTGAYSLVGCTVGPGFDFSDFALAADHPEAARALRAHPPLGKLL